MDEFASAFPYANDRITGYQVRSNQERKENPSFLTSKGQEEFIHPLTMS